MASNGYEPRKPVATTFDGHKLTAKEAKFIAEYMVSNSIKEAEAAAGYQKGCGNSVLHKPYILAEINHRLEEMASSKIADATEILQYFSAVMRGELTDQFGLEAPLSERTKAAMELAKRQIDIPQRLSGDQPEIKITLNWGDTNITSQEPSNE